MAATSPAERGWRTARPLAILLVALASLILAGWAAGALLVPHTGAFDTGASARLVMTGEVWVDVWTGVSALGSGGVVVLGGLALSAVLLNRRRFDLVAVVVLGAAGSFALSQAVKMLVDRPRPGFAQVVATGASFPSGHATESAAFYGVLIAVAALLPLRPAVRWAVVSACVLVMLAVAYSRLALGVHFPTDVIAGLLLGGAWAAVTVAVVHGPAGAPWRPGRSPAGGAGPRIVGPAAVTSTGPLTTADLR